MQWLGILCSTLRSDIWRSHPHVRQTLRVWPGVSGAHGEGSAPTRRSAPAQVRTSITLPHGTGKTVRVAVFCSAEEEEEVLAMGAFKARPRHALLRMCAGARAHARSCARKRSCIRPYVCTLHVRTHVCRCAGTSKFACRHECMRMQFCRHVGLCVCKSVAVCMSIGLHA